MNKETDLTYLNSLNPKFGKTQTMIIQLQQENKRLKDNWNELKEYLKHEIEFDKRWYIPEAEEYIAQKHFPDDTIDGFRYALNKIQELEKGDRNE